MTQTRTHWLTAAALAIPVALGCAGRINAQEAEIRVSYADLNLATPTGVKTLYSRIHGAAERYCEGLFSHTGSRIASGYDACVVDAIDNTVHALNVPSLSALHADRGKSRHQS